jgi:hypothetical protein
VPEQNVIDISQTEVKSGRRLWTIWRALGHEIKQWEVKTSIPSRKVRINNLAGEAQNAEWQTSKHAV